MRTEKSFLLEKDRAPVKTKFKKTSPTVSPASVLAIREKLDLTQEEFARECGTTPTTISRWENGHVRPTRMACAMLKILAGEAGIRVELK